jgi:hypothetical protein
MTANEKDEECSENSVIGGVVGKLVVFSPEGMASWWHLG